MEKEMKEFLDQVDQKLAKQKADQEAILEAQKAANQKLQDEINQKVEDLTKQGKTIGEIKSEVTELIAKVGKMNPGGDDLKENAFDLGSIFHKMIGENVKAFEEVFRTKGLAIVHKAVGDMSTSNNHTGNSALTQFNRSPLLFPQFRHMRNILNVVSSNTLSVDYPQEVNPDGEGSVGPQTEGSAKDQIDLDTKMVSLVLDYEAGFATVTRQMLTNVPWLQSYLTRKLSEKFYRREDVKVLNKLHSDCLAASTSATVVAEAIIDMIAQVDTEGYAANGILTTPAHWATILKTKPNDYSVPGGVSIGLNGEVMIGGLSLFKHQNVTSGNIYVGDWNALYIVQGDTFSIRSSDQHSDNFTKNKVTFLAEAPIGVAFEAPRAIVKKNL